MNTVTAITPDVGADLAELDALNDTASMEQREREYYERLEYEERERGQLRERRQTVKAGDVLTVILVVAGGAVLAAIVERSAVFQAHLNSRLHLGR